MKEILIVGAGGVGKETALLIEQINEVKPTWRLLGFLDDNKSLHGTEINGYKVLGGIDEIESFTNVYAVCAIASYNVKKKIVEKLCNTNISFASIVHPSISIHRTCSIGEDVIIYSGVTMTSNVKIGNHVILSPGCGIGHEAVVEDYCSILWDVNISGNVHIGTGCFLGTGSTVIQNIRLGREAIIGAGAVVIKDVPEGCTAVGVPARVVKVTGC
ncbi:acetyltransferase [Clostridium thermarum]|uniref:acetyltransferase n=1 Tax=Clostridium thermarum TaxID=1716543 RepID=UPI0013D3E140|nr:acetyltransferase [Clostridium thermarum]